MSNDKQKLHIMCKTISNASQLLYHEFARNPMDTPERIKEMERTIRNHMIVINDAVNDATTN